MNLDFKKWLQVVLLNGCCCSETQSCPALCNPMDCTMIDFPVLHHLLKLYQTHIHWVSDAILLVLCRPLLLLPSVFPSIRVFSNELTLHQETRVLELQPQHSSLPQHHSSKASIIWHSAFFIVQLSYPYMTTEKTIALTRWTFVGKVMSLLFNMLSGLAIAFLPRSKHLLISWLQSPSAVIFEPKKIKSVTISIVSPSRRMKWWDWMSWSLFWMLSFKPVFLFSSFSFIKRLFTSSLLSVIRVVSSAFLRLVIFHLAVLIPACFSSIPAFHMMYSAHKLNKQDDNIQPCLTPFPFWNQSVVPCPILTVAPWPACKFLRRQLRWSAILTSLRIFHSLLSSTESKSLV